MYPQSSEIEIVGEAFVTVSTPDYNDDQKEYLNRFLSDYAQDLNQQELKKIFGDKIEIMDALKTLNEFANQYQDEKDIFDEFKEEIEDLLISLNERQDGIMI